MKAELALFLTLLVLAVGRTYPLYKQCDTRWANEKMGNANSTITICQEGCLMSSVAMALTGIGHSYNPSTLNIWLKGHGGYIRTDDFIWASVKPLGMIYQGKIANSHIAAHLTAGYIVFLNVHNGRHWCLAVGMSGTSVAVHDPGYSTTAYAVSEIVEGETSIYTVSTGILGNFGHFLNHLQLVLRERSKKNIASSAVSNIQ